MVVLLSAEGNHFFKTNTMDFDEIYGSIFLSEKKILELVDEYTLYCYYTQIDPLIIGKAYNAPYYRKDDYPSFSIFPAKAEGIEFLWKDHATGEVGNIFKLIKKVECLSNNEEVFARINEDFALGYSLDNTPEIKEKIVLYEKPEQSDIKISIIEQPLTQKGITFWNKLDVNKTILDYFNTVQVKYYWTYIGQPAPTTAPDPMFSYKIGEYHQLYSPYMPKLKKFRNDLPENFFFGYMQLPKTGKTLVIDKSCKDVIFDYRLGYPGVSGKSETIMIPHLKMLELLQRFDEVYLTLDPDAAGKKQTDKYMSLYPTLKPRFLTQAKDKSDLANAVGFSEAERIIKQLLT